MPATTYQFLGLTFYGYGFLVGGAVALVWWRLEILSQQLKLAPLNLGRWLELGLITLVMARGWHLATDWSIYWPQLIQGNWLSLLAVWQGGLSILGAILGLAIGWWWLDRRQFLTRLDILALVLPIGQAVGRLANWLNQELYGLPTQLPWGIQIEAIHRVAATINLPSETKFHPLFAYEALFLLGLAWLLGCLNQTQRNWRVGQGKLWLTYLMSYSLMRFSLDFLRLDRSQVGWGLGINQWILLSVLSLGGIFWWQRSSSWQRFWKFWSLKSKKRQLWITRGVMLGVFSCLVVGSSWQFGKFNQAQKLSQFFSNQADLSQVKLQFNSSVASKITKTSEVTVILAKTDSSRTQGLGDKNLTETTGMLFWFPTSDRWAFWMKNMRFGLDFVWMADDRVVELTLAVPPPELAAPPKLTAPLELTALPESIRPISAAVLIPKSPVNLVLELPAGQVSQLNIQVGQRVTFLND